MASPTPQIRSVSDIKSALLHPSTTSHYEVSIGFPRNIGKYFEENGVKLNLVNQDRLNLMCCEALLPGSNFATLEITNDYHGVTERHAYRRVYDDRIDLTFYVDAEYYLPIRVFETWMKFIAQEASDAPQADKGNITSRNAEYFYRFNYPDNYVAEGLTVTKFERSSLGGISGTNAGYLSYEFIRSYPISITSMPVSYESASLLKCTVSMTYIRYVVNNLAEKREAEPTPPPVEQAAFNAEPQKVDGPRREDLDIWALTNRKMINNVGTEKQRAILADTDSYYKNNTSRQQRLQNLTTKGGYTVPGPTARPAMGPGPLTPTGRALPGTRLRFI